MKIEGQNQPSVVNSVNNEPVKEAKHPRDVTPDVLCDTSSSSIAGKLGKSEEWVSGMLIHREGGLESSNMTAFGLHQVVKNSKSYRCTSESGLVEVNEKSKRIDLESEVLKREHDRAPNHVTINAEWTKEELGEGGAENILGGNVCFKIASDESQIKLPIIEANNESLLYYGAMLVDENQVVSFPNEEYPIWKMELGENYVDGYIMTDEGKGFYLEWHTDRPHWHQPLTEDSGGYYILGRKVEGDNGSEQYNLTGFHIPFGKAVYSKQGAIHCDAGLTGKNWIVGFADSENFSTALVRNNDLDMVKLGKE